jgi:hypothetical protein
VVAKAVRNTFQIAAEKNREERARKAKEAAASAMNSA